MIDPLLLSCAPAFTHFSGSYLSSDVHLLLKPISIETTPVEEKEQRIQSGSAHYSEMISEERRPDARYLQLFEQACLPGVPRLAREIRALARSILGRIGMGNLVTLCSLVRAGVPYGVLLRRELERCGMDVAHYGISIVRDRGLDEVAMRYILKRRPAQSIVFLDGWTGKGAIASELHGSWKRLTGMVPTLAVVADPCGRADLCGSREDWLIPSGILGGSVSGLFSRSILRSDVVGPGDFHGCMSLNYLADIDLSRMFVDRVDAVMVQLPDAVGVNSQADPAVADSFRQAAERTVEAVSRRFGVANLNRIKPGIAEATRAVLRRRPDMVLVRSIDGDEDLAALIHLCCQDCVDLVEAPDLTGPYRAITLIKETK